MVPDRESQCRARALRGSCLSVAQELGRRRRRRSRGGRTSASSSSSAGRRARRPPTTGRSSIAPTARIAACGGLRTATNCSTPYMPRFEIVNVPPSRSSCESLPSRARCDELAARRRRSATSDLRSALADDRDDEPALGARRRCRCSRSGRSGPRRRRSARSRRGGASARARRPSSGRRCTVDAVSSLAQALAERESTRVMSADIEIWKTGASQASVSRARSCLPDARNSGTTSASSGAGAGRSRAQASAAARSTSSATIAALGPGAAEARRGRCPARARSGARAARP